MTYDNLKRLTINGLRKSLKKSRISNELLHPDKKQEASQQEKRDKLDTLTQESNEILISVKGVWPFDLFPDEIAIDRQTITITRNIFWGIHSRVVCHYQDLVKADLNVGPFFGSLNIYSKYFTDGEEVVKWFSKKNATTIHAVLQGLLIAQKEGIDLRELPREEVIEKLYSIGMRE